MDHHKQLLSKLCRLCGNKIKSNSGYIHPKKLSDYKDELMSFFHLDCNPDPELYPNLLCSNCKKKLDAAKNTNNKPKIQLHVFQPHSLTCSVCFGSSLTSSKSKGSIWTSVSKTLESIGYNKLTPLSKSEKVFYKVSYTDFVAVDTTLKIHEDYTWKLYYKERLVEPPLLPNPLSSENLNDFANLLKSARYCTGNPDFADVIESRVDFVHPFVDINGAIVAYVESDDNTQLKQESFKVIRHISCSYLLFEDRTRCPACSDYRKNLFSIRTKLSNLSKDRVTDKSKTKFEDLSKNEMLHRLRNLAAAKKLAVRNVAKLSLKISKLLEKESVSINKEQDSVVSNLFSQTQNTFEESSPMWLLWEQQKTQFNTHPNGRRWHPLIIRWCLSLYHTSPAAYKQMSNAKNRFLILPHINTLKKYLQFTEPQSGFNVDIIERLIDDSDLKNLQEFQKNVSLAFDEMKIQSNLVYRKSTGKLVGFVEMGDINTEIQHLENTHHENTLEHESKKIATYVNVFMVRGIFSNLTYPLGFHSSIGFTGDQLFPLAWEATRVLESIGFKVRSWVCDGAAPNRKLFSINSFFCEGEFGYWTVNRFCKSRKIFFISDVPHLLKTTRNNFENSHGNKNSRKLHVNKMDISWNHVVNVYEWDLDTKNQSLGLRKLHKLTDAHINLSPRHRMRVKYAAQVLSSSVANALEIQGKHDTKETIRFIRFVDRAFDCLNVTKVRSDGKKDLRPYSDVNDERFKFLESFLDYFSTWKKQVDANHGISKSERERFCLSHQTITGWNITIKSFVELGKILLREDGVKFLLSEKFSQDPLEEHFARQRRSGGSCDNPTLDRFARQEVALNLVKSNLITDLRGNTTSNRSDSFLTAEDMSLPRKRKR